MSTFFALPCSKSIYKFRDFYRCRIFSFPILFFSSKPSTLTEKDPDYKQALCSLTSNLSKNDELSKLKSSIRLPEKGPKLYGVGDYEEYSPDVETIDDLPLRPIDPIEERRKALGLTSKTDSFKSQADIYNETQIKDAFYKPLSPNQLAADEVTRQALSVRPTFPTVPWDIGPSIPHTWDPVSKSWKQKYPSRLIKEESAKIAAEILRDLQAKNILERDPWKKYYEWSQHPFFSTRNAIRHAFPGLGTAVVVFSGYCIAEYLYDNIVT